jgi:hypothetical protein
MRPGHNSLICRRPDEAGHPMVSAEPSACAAERGFPTDHEQATGAEAIYTSGMAGCQDKLAQIRAAVPGAAPGRAGQLARGGRKHPAAGYG